MNEIAHKKFQKVQLQRKMENLDIDFCKEFFILDYDWF